jgi:hypothetical protein
MTAVESIVAGAYVVWMALVLVRQFPGRPGRVIGAFDVLAIVPHFGLFSGTPPCDFRFARRVRRVDGTLGAWVAVEIGRRPAGAAVWHPQFLERLLLLKFAARAAAAQGLAARERLQRTPQYRAFLGFLRAGVPPHDATAIQFAVFAYTAFASEGPPALVFVSDLHDLHDLHAGHP